MTSGGLKGESDGEFEVLGPAEDWLAVASEGQDGDVVPAKKERPKVGYLRGRGGWVTRTPAAALDVLAGELREVMEGVEGLVKDVRRIEQAFFLVERAFKRTQPPMFRRLHVRWWRTSGKDTRRIPVLVRVNGTKAGAEVVERVPDRHVRLRKDGSFGLSADLAREVFELYWGLWALRSDAQRVLSEVVVALRGWKRRRGGGPERVAYEALRLRAEATTRLRRMGFPFAPDAGPTWPLPEDFWEWLDGEIRWVVERGWGKEEWPGAEGEEGEEDGASG
jgi:hypothetical protein